MVVQECAPCKQILKVHARTAILRTPVLCKSLPRNSRLHAAQAITERIYGRYCALCILVVCSSSRNLGWGVARVVARRANCFRFLCHGNSRIIYCESTPCSSFTR